MAVDPGPNGPGSLLHDQLGMKRARGLQALEDADDPPRIDVEPRQPLDEIADRRRAEADGGDVEVVFPGQSEGLSCGAQSRT